MNTLHELIIILEDRLGPGTDPDVGTLTPRQNAVTWTAFNLGRARSTVYSWLTKNNPDIPQDTLRLLNILVADLDTHHFRQ